MGLWKVRKMLPNWALNRALVTHLPEETRALGGLPGGGPGPPARAPHSPQLLPLLHPGGQHLPRLGVLVGLGETGVLPALSGPGAAPPPPPRACGPHLHALQQPRERLLPRQRVHVLLRVDDADLALQLGDDGTRAPAVSQHEVRQVAVEVVPEVEHSGAAPLRQPQEVKQVSLGGGGDTATLTVPRGLPWGSSRQASPEAARPDAGLPFPAASWAPLGPGPRVSRRQEGLPALCPHTRAREGWSPLCGKQTAAATPRPRSQQATPAQQTSL